MRSFSSSTAASSVVGHRVAQWFIARDQSTVDADVAAGDERRPVGAQERDRVARCRRRARAAPSSDPDRSPPTGVISAIRVLIGLCTSSSRPISVSMSPGDSDTTRPPRAPHATAARSHKPDHRRASRVDTSRRGRDRHRRATETASSRSAASGSSSTASIAGSNAPMWPDTDARHTAALPGPHERQERVEQPRDRDEVDAQDLAASPPSTARGPRCARASAGHRARRHAPRARRRTPVRRGRRRRVHTCRGRPRARCVPRPPRAGRASTSVSSTTSTAGASAQRARRTHRAAPHRVTTATVVNAGSLRLDLRRERARSCRVADRGALAGAGAAARRPACPSPGRGGSAKPV